MTAGRWKDLPTGGVRIWTSLEGKRVAMGDFDVLDKDAYIAFANPRLRRYGLAWAKCERCGSYGIEDLATDPAPGTCPDCLEGILEGSLRSAQRALGVLN